MIKQIVTVLLASLFAMQSMTLIAQPSGDGMHSQDQAKHPQGSSDKNRKGKRKPPQAALSACEGKTAKSACEFTVKNGDLLSGLCLSPQESIPLACVPEKHLERLKSREGESSPSQQGKPERR